jgi:hypothetical protein
VICSADTRVLDPHVTRHRGQPGGDRRSPAPVPEQQQVRAVRV